MTEFVSHEAAEAQTKLAKVSRLPRLVVGVGKLIAVFKDPMTPAWAKAAAAVAIAYFLLPTDAVPDFVPLVGYGDDLAVISAAVASIYAKLR